MEPKAVLFDFDGILVDTEWAIYQAWLRTFQKEGQDLPLSLYTKCIGSDFDTWSPKTYLEELTGQEFDWIKKDADRQVEIRSELEEEGAIPGVEDFLEAIREKGVPMAVVSSSSHDWVDGWLEKLSLGKWFQDVICKEDAPRLKPAPDLYLEGARRLDMEPGSCLVIEDSLNGLISATAAGMKTWVVPNRVTSKLDFSAAEMTLKDFQLAKETFSKK
ncbi:MAG: HAD family hydrolase [Luteolibacter sp.]